MQRHLKEPSIKQLLEAILLNAGSIDSINLNDGKLGLSLCLFEVAKYLNDESAEDAAFTLLQEVLALRQKGKAVKPMEIGFVLLYLIENRLIEADFDDLFGEEKERLLKSISVIKPYSATHLIFIPFLSLLYNLNNVELVCQLMVKILDGAALSLEQQFNQMQANRFMPNLQTCENAFENYLRSSSLLDDYVISPHVLEHYEKLYLQERIPNRFTTGFYIEKLFPENERLRSFGKSIQAYAAQNIYPDILSLSQRINLLYLLKQEESIYKVQIQQLEKRMFNNDISMYEKQIARMIPLNKSTIAYEAGIARLLLYWI